MKNGSEADEETEAGSTKDNAPVIDIPIRILLHVERRKAMSTALLHEQLDNLRLRLLRGHDFDGWRFRRPIYVMSRSV